jgi:hypothetical protein
MTIQTIIEKFQKFFNIKFYLEVVVAVILFIYATCDK